MARSTPRVDTTVAGDVADPASSIAVGSSAWYAWLEDATAFAFRSPEGSFSARKERRGQRGWYWKAYRKHNGTLHRAYLGKSTDLTYERLIRVASDLAGHGPGLHPPESPSQVAPPFVSMEEELSSPPRPQLPRGTLTFLFTDIEGSTQLWEQHPHAMPQALARHDAILRDVIAGHTGVVFKTVGDGVHAVFAQAADAVAAALAAQRALDAADWAAVGSLRVRMALHTGTAELRDGDYFGGPLNRLARILALGYGGQVLLSQATHDLVVDDLPERTTLRSLGEYQLKDLQRPEPIFQLVSPELPADFPALRAAPTTPPPTQTLALLKSKFYIPPARPTLVPRPRLLARLDAGLSGKLTLLSAPAGFGKTTLVSAWLATPAGNTVPFAWVSLDAADSEPLRFWSYVIAALDMIQPDSGATALALLQSPQPPPIEAVLTPLLNALGALATDAVLVLDDYHLIDAPAIHTALTFVLDHLPARLHLLITTRADPSLSLTRLRARGQLTELRAADLRFTAEESTAFLTELMGLPLSADHVAALEARTEGWIAGLQLAALAMRDRSDISGFIAAFTGSNRFVVDYLAEEVFASQPRHIQTFLLQTAILDRMCGPLCDAVLGLMPDEEPRTKDERHAEVSKSFPKTAQPLSSLVVRPSSDSYSRLILEQLERANLFIVPLDDARAWYRYHHLFAEVLRARLHSGATATEVATLHQRASTWYEQQGLMTEAVQHALTAQDWEQAADLIQNHGSLLVLSGQIHTVLSWLQTLPDAVVQRRPRLYIVAATGLMLTNQMDAAELRLRDAESSLQPDSPDDFARAVRGNVALVRGCIRISAGDLAQGMRLVQETLELLPETTTNVAAGILSARARSVAAMFAATAAYRLTGDVSAASEQRIIAIIASARAAFVSAMQGAYIALAALQMLQGRLRAAVATFAQIERLAPGQDALQVLIGSPAYYFSMGDLWREWDDLDAADGYLARGMEVVMGGMGAGADEIMLGYLALARVQQARGKHEVALATVEAFMQLAHERRFFPQLIEQARAMRARLQLLQGDLSAGLAWMEASGLSPTDEISFPQETAHLTLARVYIAAGQTATVLPLLDRLLADAEAKARMHSAINILVLRALALKARGDTAGALTTLKRAIELGALEGYIRVFVDEGPAMAELLGEAQRRGIAPDYMAKLLAAFPRTEGQGLRTESPESLHLVLSPQSSALVEALTDRELEILRLIAEGHSNQAIADTLVVAVSTVKRHINNIYGKLDVQSRTQALVRARELQLL